ncbi:MAG TPA: pirin family protein [Cytophagaceae bacterium]|nr:pirin family protein [Cytophagaceae bacterium]
MERRNFIKNTVLGGFLLSSFSSFGKIFSTSTSDKYRSVEGVLSPSRTHMVGNGFKVMNFYPNGKGFEERMSPFFLLDFNAEVNYPPSEISRGVGVHPHRGIETITIAYKGSVAHHDSAGNAGVINPGDVQWMTAGGGVLHKEYHETEYTKRGGAFEMIQLWINLPKKHKMTPAKYQSILHGKKGNVTLDQNAGSLHVIAGEYKGVKGPAITFSPVHMYDVHLNAEGETTITLPGNFNTGLLVVDGDIVVNEFYKVPENHYVQFKNEEGAFHIKANKKTILLVLSGEPLNEPFVGYGPFVMNTEEEIHQAIEDYNNGKFGFLAD